MFHSFTRSKHLRTWEVDLWLMHAQYRRLSFDRVVSTFACSIAKVIARTLIIPDRTVVTLERLRFKFTPKGKREFLPRDQVFALIVNCLLLQLKNK